MGPRNELQVSYYAPSCTCDIPDGYESLQDRIRRPFPMGCVPTRPPESPSQVIGVERPPLGRLGNHDRSGQIVVWVAGCRRGPWWQIPVAAATTGIWPLPPTVPTVEAVVAVFERLPSNSSRLADSPAASIRALSSSPLSRSVSRAAFAQPPNRAHLHRGPNARSGPRSVSRLSHPGASPSLPRLAVVLRIWAVFGECEACNLLIIKDRVLPETNVVP